MSVRKPFSLRTGAKGSAREDFEILSTLGKGNFGAVYAAIHKPSGTPVALKKMALNDPVSIASVKLEVSILEEAKNPFVVTYYSHFESISPEGEKFLWVVMELCEGGSVADGLAAYGKPLSEPQIACLCKAVLKGLVYLHKKGQVHRDIKPDNILITSSGEAKLADFGVSGTLDGRQAMSTVVGTPFFFAPEMIKTEQGGYGAKVDVWALGISAIEMAELAVPNADQNPMRAVFLILENAAPRLKNTDSKWSKEFEDFVAKCLAKDPERRPSANSLLRHPFIESNKDTSALVGLTAEFIKARNEKRRRGESSTTTVFSPTAPHSKSSQRSQGSHDSLNSRNHSRKFAASADFKQKSRHGSTRERMSSRSSSGLTLSESQLQPSICASENRHRRKPSEPTLNATTVNPEKLAAQAVGRNSVGDLRSHRKKNSEPINEVWTSRPVATRSPNAKTETKLRATASSRSHRKQTSEPITEGWTEGPVAARSPTAKIESKLTATGDVRLHRKKVSDPTNEGWTKGTTVTRSPNAKSESKLKATNRSRSNGTAVSEPCYNPPLMESSVFPIFISEPISDDEPRDIRHERLPSKERGSGGLNSKKESHSVRSTSNMVAGPTANGFDKREDAHHSRTSVSSSDVSRRQPSSGTEPEGRVGLKHEPRRPRSGATQPKESSGAINSPAAGRDGPVKTTTSTLTDSVNMKSLDQRLTDQHKHRSQSVHVKEKASKSEADFSSSNQSEETRRGHGAAYVKGSSKSGLRSDEKAHGVRGLNSAAAGPSPRGTILLGVAARKTDEAEARHASRHLNSTRKQSSKDSSSVTSRSRVRAEGESTAKTKRQEA